jgi:hypothetical protein
MLAADRSSRRRPPKGDRAEVCPEPTRTAAASRFEGAPDLGSGRAELPPDNLERDPGCSSLNRIYLQVLETAATRFQERLHFTKSGGIFRQRDRGVGMVNAVMLHAED